MGRFKQWEELTIQDNFLFQKVMQNQRICKCLIEKILGIRIEKITFPEGEKSIDNRYDSKSIRLDVYVHDENGHVYDIEMQCTNGSEGELPKRTRYYQGMIDMDELKKGQYYTELKESFIIFICTFDPFGENLPMYTFRHRCIEKEGLELGDLSTKIFLNAKGESDTLDPDIAAFLRYVDGKTAEGALTKEINEEVIRIKEHKEMRREYMTLLMELQKYKTEGMQEGIEIGMEKKGRTVIMNLLKLNMPIDNIAAATESPIPYVKEMQRGYASQKGSFASSSSSTSSMKASTSRP